MIKLVPINFAMIACLLDTVPDEPMTGTMKVSLIVEWLLQPMDITASGDRVMDSLMPHDAWC